MSSANGVRLRWGLLGSLIGALLTVATLLASGAWRVGVYTQRLSAVEDLGRANHRELKEHLAAVAEGMPQMYQARQEITDMRTHMDELKKDLSDLRKEQAEVLKAVYGVARRVERLGGVP